MAFRRGGFDLATGALILGGAALLAVALVFSVMLLSPPTPAGVASVPPSEPTPAPAPTGRPAAELPADRVAIVLVVDASAGAGGVARAGDHVDVLGFFSPQSTGSGAVTRVLLQNVPVLGVDRSGSGVALTLAVPQTSALLLQEAQAIGARPYVTLRPLQPLADLPPSFSDTDLANRMSGGAPQ